MTRSTTRIQTLVLVLFVACFASPAAAWSGYGQGYDHNGDHGNYSQGYWHDRDRDDDRARNPSCWIEARPNTVNYYGGEVTFEWESNDADWAEITDIGVVPTDGSMRVAVHTSKTYTMTVYADGRSSECDTFVNVIGEYRSQGGYYNNYTNYGYQYPYQGYQYPYQQGYQAPYVSLTQIPYTGFDFGPLGNAIYWVMLIGMAAVAAYLLVFQSGIRALVSVPVVSDVVRAGRMQYKALQSVITPVEEPVAIPVAEEAAPAAAKRTGDLMQIVAGEIPRIVISRD